MQNSVAPLEDLEGNAFDTWHSSLADKISFYRHILNLTIDLWRAFTYSTVLRSIHFVSFKKLCKIIVEDPSVELVINMPSDHKKLPTQNANVTSPLDKAIHHGPGPAG